ncbi:MAG: hypothetical protein ACPGRE_08560 [Flavobacteriaceae bacterium]
MNYLKLGVLPAAILSLSLASCTDTTDSPVVEPETGTPFHIAADVTDPDESVAVFMQPLSDLTSGNITFENTGYEMDGVRSARVLTAGDRIYNLNYGGGTISELEFDGVDSYDQTAYVSIDQYVGLYPRFGAIGDDYLLAHNVVNEYNEETAVTTITLQIVKLGLPGLTLEDYDNIVLGEYQVGDDYIFRVDAPVVLGDKLFYGTGYRKLGESGSSDAQRPAAMATLVLDWPSLENPTTVLSEASQGDTYGYRGRSMHVYNDKVYQINMTTGGSDAVITRLNAEGTYDDYVLNITSKLGGSRSSVNWHDGGNGKFYAAIQDNAIESDNSYAMYSINLDASSVDLIPNIPLSDMWYYQSGAQDGNDYHIAVSPVGENAYIWALNGTTAVQGAQLDGGNIFVQGIYR